MRIYTNPYKVLENKFFYVMSQEFAKQNSFINSLIYNLFINKYAYINLIYYLFRYSENALALVLF